MGHATTTLGYAAFFMGIKCLYGYYSAVYYQMQNTTYEVGLNTQEDFMRGFVTLLTETRITIGFHSTIYNGLDVHDHKHQLRVADLWNVQTKDNFTTGRVTRGVSDGRCWVGQRMGG